MGHIDGIPIITETFTGTKKENEKLKKRKQKVKKEKRGEIFEKSDWEYLFSI